MDKREKREVSKARILIVDDDVTLGERLVRYLDQFDYAAESVEAPGLALVRLDASVYDLIILDVMMPGMDGFEFLRQLRKTNPVPVILLTARGEVSDRIVGLELGADDYLPKPFEPRELVARIQTVLRRASAPSVDQQERLRFGGLEIVPSSQEAYLDGRALGLTHLEFELLLALARRPRHVLDRDALMDRLRGLEWDAFNRSMDVAVSRLRQKLGDDSRRPTWIKTVWGAGYMFIGGEDA